MIIYRSLTREQIPAAVELVRAERGITDELALAAMPDLWARWLPGPAWRGIVWERIVPSGRHPLLAIGISVFVTPAFAAQLASGGTPAAALALYHAVLQGHEPLVSAREFARGNGGDGLALLVLHNPLRIRQLDDPRNTDLLPLGPAAFQAAHSGINVRQVYWQVYGSDQAAYLVTGGFERVSAAPGEDNAGDRRPILMGRAAGSALTYDSMYFGLFQARRPRFGFTPAQQRVLRLALEGHGDRQIAQLMQVSSAGVKKHWRAVFDRSAGDLIGLLPRLTGDASGPDLGARRAVLLNVLRQHPEELHPYESPARPARTAEGAPAAPAPRRARAAPRGP